MRTRRTPTPLSATVLRLAAWSHLAQASPPDARPDLGGTALRMVRSQGGDGTTLTPEDRAKYTIAFGPDGQLSVRIDRNRGRGTRRSSRARS